MFLALIRFLAALVAVAEGAKILSLLHSWDRYIDQDFKNYYSNVTYEVVLDVAKDDVYIVFAGRRHYWRGHEYLKSCIKQSKRIKNDSEFPSFWALPLAGNAACYINNRSFTHSLAHSLTQLMSLHPHCCTMTCRRNVGHYWHPNFTKGSIVKRGKTESLSSYSTILVPPIDITWNLDSLM